MPSLNNILASLTCLMAVTNALPTITPRAVQSQCSSGSQPIQHTPSALYNVFPQHPDLAKNSLGFHVESYDNSSQVEQVVVFSGIPANAKKCTLGWRQGSRIERTFIVKGGDALTGVRQLAGPLEKGVTYNTIKPFDDGDEIGAADFTNWDDLEPQGHIIGSLECATSLYFKFGLRNNQDNTKVFLNQGKHDGIYITYSC